MMTRGLSALDIVIIIVLIIVAAYSYLSFSTTHYSNYNNCCLDILFIDGIKLERHGHSAITPTKRQLGQLHNPQVRAKFVPKTTAGLNSINKTRLKSLLVSCPPIALQEKFVNLVNIYEAIKRKQENSENIISRLVETLLHNLLRKRQ